MTVYLNAKELMKEKGSGTLYKYHGIVNNVAISECFALGYMTEGRMEELYFPVDSVTQCELKLPEFNQDCRIGSYKDNGYAIVKVD